MLIGAADAIGLLVALVTAVVCTTSPWLSATVDARVPGLSVLVRALFMANVNWLLDLVSDTAATPVAHCAMRASALLQYLIAQTEDRGPNETLHALADRVALQWGALFTGRTLRAWLASLLDNDLKVPDLN